MVASGLATSRRRNSDQKCRTIYRDEEHDRQDIHSHLEHKVAARILKDDLAGKVMELPQF